MFSAVVNDCPTGAKLALESEFGLLIDLKSQLRNRWKMRRLLNSFWPNNFGFLKTIVLLTDNKDGFPENAFQVRNVASSWFIWSFKSNNHESFAEFALFLHILPKVLSSISWAKTVVGAQIETLNVREKSEKWKETIFFSKDNISLD